MKWIQAGSYAIQPTKEGIFVLEIPSSDTKTDLPTLIYDNGEHALLYRNQESGMVLDYIHPKVRNDLYNAKEVAVCEYDLEKDEVSDFYRIPVQQVPNIAVKLFQSKL